MKYTEYEIYVASPYGSDVVVKDTLDEAIKVAEEWSREVKDYEVIIEKIERDFVMRFKQGENYEKK